MKQVLLFPETMTKAPGESVTPERYLAIIQEDLNPKELGALSPVLMAWTDDLWLIDLQSCLTYWQHQAHKVQKSLVNFLRSLLNKILPEDRYHAALNHQPWPAILLARVMQDKALSGLLTLNSEIGRNIYHAMPWSIWLQACDEYLTVCLNRQHVSAGKYSQHRTHLQRLQRSISRLGIRSPAQIENLPPQQIRRRFGTLIAHLWSTSFPFLYTQNNMKNSLEEMTAFPWESYELVEKPCRKRVLDYPLMEWDHMNRLLCEDFNALCLLSSFKESECIISLEWRVVLQDLTEIPITIFFRHPHALHREAPHQRTALLQAYYQFSRLRQKLAQHYQDTDSPVPPFISWELTITGTLTVTPLESLLFHDSHDESKLIDLENRLPIALEAYDMQTSWVPEDAYVATSKHQKNPDPSQPSPAEHHSLNSAARLRPLYIHPKPRAFQQIGQSGLWRFRERTMDKWWQSQRSPHSRDYYQYICQGKHLWIFQNSAGEWYVHGIYG
jgi:hypothetical protein